MFSITVKKVKQHLRRNLKKRNMYVSIIYEQSWRRVLGREMFETMVLHPFLFISNSVSYLVFLHTDHYYNRHTQVTARHSWGLEGHHL